MMLTLISPLALIVGIATHMLIGMLWYSPLMFGPLWMKLVKVRAEDLHMGAKHIIGSLLTALTLTIVVGHFIKLLGIATCLASIQMTSLLWLGLIATTGFSPVLWENRPMGLYHISMAHWFVTLTMIGCIVTKL
jgi:Protein of unknown function (DUF1761)